MSDPPTIPPGKRANRRWTEADLAAVIGNHQVNNDGVNYAMPSGRVKAPLAIRPPWNYEIFEPFSFELPWSPSVNSAYANAKSGRVKSTKAREYAHHVCAALMFQRVPARCIAHPCEITMIQHAPTEQGDPDNGIKIVLDCLKRFGVIADDNRKIIKRLVIEDSTTEVGGRVEMRIAPWSRPNVEA